MSVVSKRRRTLSSAGSKWRLAARADAATSAASSVHFGAAECERPLPPPGMRSDDGVLGLCGVRDMQLTMDLQFPTPQLINRDHILHSSEMPLHTTLRPPASSAQPGTSCRSSIRPCTARQAPG